MPAIIAVIGGLIAKLFAASVIKFLAIKAILLTLTTLVLPVVLFNVFVKVQESIMNYALSQVSSSGVTSSTIQIAGVGAWVGQEIQLSLCMSMIMSAVATRFVLNMLGK